MSSVYGSISITLPWTNGALSFSTLTDLGGHAPRIYTPEHWFALVNEHDVGLSVFEPASALYFSGVRVPGDPGSTGFGTNYFDPHGDVHVQPQ